MSNGVHKKFEYTRKGDSLTEEQRNFYEENGYLVFKKIVSDEVIDNCRQRFVDICENRVPKHKWIVLAKDVSLKQKGITGEHLIDKMQYISYDDVMYEYLSYKPMIDIVSDIVGPNITAVHNMLINKPPDSDKDASTHPLHQDMHYFPFRPINSVVATWTAMEKVDISNGCLYVIPGTHKYDELFSHSYPPNEKKAMYHEIVGYKKLVGNKERVDLIMEKGDTVFFHPLLFHGSHPNTTKRFRKAITCHYGDSYCYFVDVKGTTQEHITDELSSIVVKQGYPFEYKGYWRLKSRLIRGIPGSFQYDFINEQKAS